MTAQPEHSYAESFALALERRTAEYKRKIAVLEEELLAAQRNGRLDAYVKELPSVREQILDFLD